MSLSVILGNGNCAVEENRNAAWMTALLAVLPLHIPGIIANRLCASGITDEAIMRFHWNL